MGSPTLGAVAQRKCAGRVLIIVENRPAANDHRVAKQIDSLVSGGYAVQVMS
jgi:hypothetical protein